MSHLLIVVGLVAVVYGMSLLWQRIKPAKFSELEIISQSSDFNSDGDSLFAVQLLNADHRIQVPVIRGHFVNGEWELSEDAALVIQADDASDSATVVYGHNFPRILGELHMVQAGESFELVMSDWSKKQYKVTEVMEVSPDQVQVLFTDSSNDLIVYTCSGFLDSKRLVVRARLVDALAST